jgi:hypothetical protein
MNRRRLVLPIGLWSLSDVKIGIGLALVAALSLLVSSALYAAQDEPSGSRVRTDNPRLAEVIRYALQRSPSFGDLLATFETLNRVIYVNEGSCRHREMHACLELMTPPGEKNILVWVTPRESIDSVVSQLAHELYHALEVARESGVVDDSSLGELYERIGDERCPGASGKCFETRAAVTFEALVIRQLKAINPSSTDSRTR